MEQTDNPQKKSRMLTLTGVVVCLLVIGTAAGLWLMRGGPALPQPTINDLNFPVVVFFSPTSFSVDHSAEELTTMNIQRVLMQQKPPHLIDNQLNLFQLDELNSTRSSYTLLLNAGTGTTPVSFTLKPVRDETRTEARKLLIGIVNPELPDDEAAAMKSRIRSAQRLTEIFQAD
ncbi:MAG: hypothetical protein ABIK07_18195 [Planctomycetota bacterium]